MNIVLVGVNAFLHLFCLVLMFVIDGREFVVTPGGAFGLPVCHEKFSRPAERSTSKKIEINEWRALLACAERIWLLRKEWGYTTKDDVRSIALAEFGRMIDSVFEPPQKLTSDGPLDVALRPPTDDPVVIFPDAADVFDRVERLIEALRIDPEKVVTADEQLVIVPNAIANRLGADVTEWLVEQFEETFVDDGVVDHSVREHAVFTFADVPGGLRPCECVVTRPNDDVFYASVGGRNVGRFVRGREPGLTDRLTVVLRRRGDAWEVLRAHFGDRSEPWPTDPNATQFSLSFWRRHALVEGSVPIRDGSKRRFAPPSWTVFEPGRKAEAAALIETRRRQKRAGKLLARAIAHGEIEK